MRTSLSVRGLSALPLVLIVFGAFACTGSPTQPELIGDAATGSMPRSFDASPSFSPTAISQEEFAETEFVEQELTDESELTDDAEEVDAADFDANGLDASDFDPQSLTASTLTAAPKGTVAVAGVIKDKITKKVLASVTVKMTGLQPVTSNSRGLYRINVPPGRRTLKFSKKGYTTKSVTATFTKATKLDVLLTSVAASLSKVSLNDSNVPVGTVVTATVKLTSAAPAGGARVLLSSSSTGIATVSASSIVIAAGATSKTFKVNAKAAGTAVIKATYKNASKTANLTVAGSPPPPPPPPPPPTNPVAKFDYSPSQCPVIANPSGGVLATCTFDASDSTPAGVTYKWTFPGGNAFTRTSATFTNVPLPCGTLPNGIFDRTVTLTVTTSSGVVSASFPLSVTFTKTGLC